MPIKRHQPAPRQALTHDAPPSPPAKRNLQRVSTRKSASSLIDVWFEGHQSAVRGETALWVAVITQALMDALNRSKHPEHRYHKQAAIQWLTGNSRDFHWVCEMADLDPNCVRRKAKRALLSPVAWRAAPGKGARYHERKEHRQRMKNTKTRKTDNEDAPGASVRALIISGPW